jgi:tRNA (guanine-N7-)-methyltransferase
LARALASPPMHPPVRSFRRRGRMTPARRVRFAEFSPRYCVTLDQVAAWAPEILDVGFGIGESVLGTAAERPQVRILAVDVHEAGVTRLITDLAERDIDTVRVIRNDVLDLLPLIPSASLAEICVFFPDPWPKASHVHRRLIRPDVVAAFTDRLGVGGLLRLATDAEHYAAQMRYVCGSVAELQVETPPPRASTRYERLGREAGRESVDLAYRRTDPARSLPSPPG